MKKKKISQSYCLYARIFKGLKNIKGIHVQPKSAIVFLLIFASISVEAQKRLIDSNTFGSWPSVGNVKMSNNGAYSIYSVTHTNNHSEAASLHLVLNATGKEIANSKVVRSAEFTNDSRYVVFMHTADSLGILETHTCSISYVPKILSYKVCEGGTGGLVAFLKMQNNTLIVKRPNRKKELTFSDVRFYDFSEDGSSLVIGCTNQINQRESLKWVDLSTGNTRIIWTGKQIGQYVFDRSCTHLAFTGTELNGKDPGVYHFQKNKTEASCVVSGEKLRQQRIQIAFGKLQFSNNSDRLLLAIQELPEINVPKRIHNGVVTVWNYKDASLQSEQKLQEPLQDMSSQYQWSGHTNWVTLDLVSATLIHLNASNEDLVQRGGFEDYFLVRSSPGNALDNPDTPFFLCLVSTKDGTKVKIIDKCPYISDFAISPDERFVLWFDPFRTRYCDLEITNHVIRTLGESIANQLVNKDQIENGRFPYATYGICGWSGKDNCVYLYDQYDIWKIDLLGKFEPINATHGYGREHLKVLGVENSYPDLQNFDATSSTLLSIYDPETKDNGIISIDSKFNPTNYDIPLEPCSYWVARTGFRGFVQTADGFPPIRARDCEKFILKRETASRFPNVCITDNFRHYRQISFLAPESKYNWLRTELISWKKPDGEEAQGILYVPENFDTLKKYPVIFECYEKMSDGLHRYNAPELNGARIDISYYVSNGYLVFEPDISWKYHHMGEGVVATLVSAAKHLSKYNWVDSTKLGLQGHSFGGWVADYAVTHTHVFAAICAASGISDEISGYTELTPDGNNLQRTFEDMQGGFYGIGVTPWTNPDLYMENSPIFGTDEVTTPLLLMHGENDGAVPFVQGVEMYLALRRAHKKVWLLAYNKQGHNVHDKAAVDYTIRIKQFFDHYLKSEPAPVWMTNGVPYYHKDGANGLELDHSGSKL